MKTKILSILASGLIVLTGLLTTASTFPGYDLLAGNRGTGQFLHS